MDPSRLVVRAIAPTRISADSFMAALRFSLGGRDPQQVHGGFGSGYASQEEDDGDGRPAPCVVTGEGREAITGALPLWLCKEHWAVAALLARPLLGWMTTLSPLVGAATGTLRRHPCCAVPIPAQRPALPRFPARARPLPVAARSGTVQAFPLLEP